MNMLHTYSELQEAVDYMESHDLSDDPQCEALREILDAADRLERNSDEATVDAAFQACREHWGTMASKDEYLNLLTDNWVSYSDLEEYAVDMAAAMGVEIPDLVKYHVDWKSVGDELIAEENIFTFFDGNVYIFRG